MQNNAKAPIFIETHLVITEVMDGDSLKVSSMFKKKEKEIRLYGIDCPENKYNRKMVEEEKKLHSWHMPSVLVMNKVDLVTNKVKMRSLQNEIEDLGEFEKIFHTST